MLAEKTKIAGMSLYTDVRQILGQIKSTDADNKFYGVVVNSWPIEQVQILALHRYAAKLLSKINLVCVDVA